MVWAALVDDQVDDQVDQVDDHDHGERQAPGGSQEALR